MLLRFSKVLFAMSAVVLASCVSNPPSPSSEVKGVKYFREAAELVPKFVGRYVVGEVRGVSANFDEVTLDLQDGVPRIRLTSKGGTLVVEQFLLDSCHGDLKSGSSGTPYLYCFSGQPTERSVSFSARAPGSSFSASNINYISPLKLPDGYMLSVERYFGTAARGPTFAAKKIQ
ncbi:hypothetical protein [Variovorax sp. PCZ-1]|uniref:hypothetical protein n=1 Tax=Variovorax sp. PCZ-1 TaxID=2835533 RepID=UPI001BD0584B|nr:hypothetical protein [Variovorax sp. PCZ-1]MBS7808444.1 hypothetical protein [Variovorax sp. PCZ-1]